MLQLKLLALLCSLSLLACCGTNEKRSQSMTLADCPVIAELVDSVTVLDLASVKDTFDIPLSLLLSSFEIIQLENSDEALINMSSAYAISENYIGLFCSNPEVYKLFDRKGKFLRDIAIKGQGPSDFLFGISDSYIDEKNNRIYLLSFMATKLLVFDLDGKVQSHIPYNFTVSRGRFHIDAAKEELIVTALPIRKTPYVIWKQDFKGNILQAIDSKPFFIKSGGYSNDITSDRNTSAVDFKLFTWKSRNESLYHYNIEENRLKPVLTIQWDGDIALHRHTELPNHYITCLLIGPASLTSTPRSPQIIIDKKTLRGCYANFKFNMLGDIDGPNYLTFNRGYFIGEMYPHAIKEQLENALAYPEKLTPQMKAKVKKLNDRITEDDNNIILLGKLRGSDK